LFNGESRNFNVTFHGSKEFSVTVKDALQTDLDTWVAASIALKQVEDDGPQRDFQTRPGQYCFFYAASP
jgi:hypothetical protein